MPVTLHPTWHPLFVHVAIGFTLGASLLVIVGAIAKGIGYKEFTLRLTYPLHVLLLLSIIFLVLAAGSALMDFPASAFAASPWFKFKTIISIITFFIYSGMYLLVALRAEDIWGSPASLAYMVVLAIAGGFLVFVLGAAGGYMAYGHSVLESVLKAMGLPLPRTT